MGYNATAYNIMLFFVAMNVCLTWISLSQVLPVDFTTSAYDPNNITSLFISVDLSTGNLILGGTALVVTTILGWAAGNLVAGGALGVGIFGLTIISPMVSWILYGVPKLLVSVGAPEFIIAGVMAMVAIPFSYFVLSMIVQRPVEGHG